MTKIDRELKKCSFFDPNYVLACEYSNAVEFSVDGTKYRWLVDTGASMSVVKYDTVVHWNIPIHPENISINGIGGKIVTEGYVYITLTHKGMEFIHKFYVLKFLPSNTNGIIGQDFLVKHNCIINFESNNLTLNYDDCQKVSLPLIMGSLGNNTFLKIPPRCEKIFYIQTVLTDTCVILPQQLGDGVFMAGSISNPINGKLPIQVLNTRENEVGLSYFNPQVEMVSEYTVCSFEESKVDGARVRKMFSRLNLSHLNNEAKISIENICAKFSDVFHLPGDKLTTSNLCEQKITLQPDAQPVYTKQYRIPFHNEAS